MKKLLLPFMLILSLAGCAQIEKGITPSPTVSITNHLQNEDENNDEHIVITVPGSFLSYREVIDFLDSIKDKGYIDEVNENSDGSTSYTINRENYSYILSTLRLRIINLFEELKSSGNYPSIKDITYNEDFTNIVFHVIKEDFEASRDEIASYVASSKGMIYAFLLNNEIEISPMNIEIKDYTTGEILKSIKYP